MNTREYLIQCFKEERPRFLRVLRAVPPDKLAYRPHPHSSSAGDLAWLLAFELRDACVMIDRGEVAFSWPPPPATLEETIAAFEKNLSELGQRIGRLDDAAWERPARLRDRQMAWEAPLGELVWSFLFDAIHHRGQLSTYLRPLGAKVPSIYGPSADDPGV